MWGFRPRGGKKRRVFFPPRDPSHKISKNASFALKIFLAGLWDTWHGNLALISILRSTFENRALRKKFCSKKSQKMAILPILPYTGAEILTFEGICLKMSIFFCTGYLCFWRTHKSPYLSFQMFPKLGKCVHSLP